MSVLIRSDWCDIVLEPAVCMLPADRVSAVTEWIAVCSEVTLAFLVFHRAGTITVDQASLALRRSEEHTSELQSRENLVCRLLLEKKKRPQSKAQQGPPWT